MNKYEKIEIDRSGIDKLKEITKNIDFSEFVEKITETSIKIKTVTGEATASGLMSKEEISVANCVVKPNTQLDCHVHDQLEILIVYKGTLLLNENGIEYKLEQGQLRYILPCVQHSISTNSYCELIAITMPQSMSFPKGA